VSAKDAVFLLKYTVLLAKDTVFSDNIVGLYELLKPYDANRKKIRINKVSTDYIYCTSAIRINFSRPFQ
jgi:hypothetical protein